MLGRAAGGAIGGELFSQPILERSRFLPGKNNQVRFSREAALGRGAGDEIVRGLNALSADFQLLAKMRDTFASSVFAAISLKARLRILDGFQQIIDLPAGGGLPSVRGSFHEVEGQKREEQGGSARQFHYVGIAAGASSGWHRMQMDSRPRHPNVSRR